MTTVYILQCANGQYYVGSTNNLADRLKEHQGDGSTGSPRGFKGAKFTKEHLPVKLVYTEEYEIEHEARMRATVTWLDKSKERSTHPWRYRTTKTIK